MTTMPVFVLKAKDKLALETVRYYRSLCIQHGLSEQVVQVELALEEMSDWCNTNPGQVKVPDHNHVPVGGEESL